MTPLAHHAGEDSVVAFLLTLGGGGVSVLAAMGRTRVAALRRGLLRRRQDDRPGPGQV
jgi:hypothetical protein